jgi:hypothetical protein
MPEFHDPIKAKVKKQKGQNPWDFRAPSYDERTSCYTDAGTHYGIGHTNPVGHTGPVKQRVPTLPYGHRLGMQTDEAPRKMLGEEFEE